METKSARQQFEDWRKKYGWSRARLAEALRLRQATISRILTGHAQPSLETALRIEGLTGIPVADWRGEDDTDAGVCAPALGVCEQRLPVSRYPRAATRSNHPKTSPPGGR